MSEIQKEFNPPAKFVQITRGDKTIVALDENGIVWYYVDVSENFFSKELEEAGWIPLADSRLERRISALERAHHRKRRSTDEQTDD